MNTSKMWPETIVSGFFYLASLIFILVRLLDPTYEQSYNIYCDLKTFNVGFLGIVSALAVGAAYLIGHLIGLLLTDLSLVVRRRRDKGRPTIQNSQIDASDRRLAGLMSGDLLASELHGRWVAKYFYRSLLPGIFIFAFASAPWTICSQNLRVALTSWALFIILELGLGRAFIAQRRSHTSLEEAIDARA